MFLKSFWKHCRNPSFPTNTETLFTSETILLSLHKYFHTTVSQFAHIWKHDKKNNNKQYLPTLLRRGFLVSKPSAFSLALHDVRFPATLREP